MPESRKNQEFFRKFSRKSQITIFMIVGLVIIIGGVIFFYATSKSQQPLEPEVRIVQDQLPVEFQPLRAFINNCAYQVAVEGLDIIGKQGGYISLTDRNLNHESFVLRPTPTESDAVFFTADSDLKIPYWWYLKSSNTCKGNCQFSSKKPDLRDTDNSIEKQLERYIDLRIKDCVGDFESFTDQGYIITENEELKTDVVIASKDVVVSVNYPLTVERQDRKLDIDQFVVNVPVNLEKVYDLAARVSNLEIEHRFIEKHVMNLIAAFSGIDREKLPPMSDMQFKFGSTVSWVKSDVKNKITDLLTSYIPLFQVEGTKNYNRNLFSSQLKQTLYDSTIIPASDVSFRDFAVSFTYLDFWPTYFDLNCDGERCVPNSANGLISFIGIQDYRFSYDLSFPVLVEVQDPLALNGRGYKFNLFLEGNVRNNKPLTADFDPLDISSSSARSQLCDIRTSGDVNIEVKDAATRAPIDDVQIIYTLIDEDCFIGSTDGEGTLTESFPIGVGGVVNTIKENYIGRSVEFDPKLDLESSLTVKLQPIYTKNVVVKKKNVVKRFIPGTGYVQEWNFKDIALDLSDKESAIITLTRINDEGELDFSSVALYEGQQEGNSLIELAPGEYEADISLTLNEKIIIPESRSCECVIDVKVFCAKKVCFDSPELDFGKGSTSGQEQFNAGGLKLKFRISSDDLVNNDNIVLYVVNIDLAGVPEASRDIDDINQLNNIEEYSSTYQVALQPDFE